MIGRVDESEAGGHPRDRLDRQLGPFDAAMLVVASVIGAGIFFTPGQVATLLPSPFWILAAWLIGGLLSLAGALANAELGERPGRFRRLDPAGAACPHGTCPQGTARRGRRRR